jgi:hypothetical protein
MPSLVAPAEGQTCSVIGKKSFTDSALWCNLPNLRRGDREAEGARLEIVCTERYRGFESLPLRHFFLPMHD